MENNERRQIGVIKTIMFYRLERRLGYTLWPWRWEKKHVIYWAGLVAQRYWRMFGSQIKFF